MQKGQWITVDSVVTDYLDEAEKGIHQYSKAWNIGFRGMEDLGIDFFYEINTVVLPINSNGTATLPSNYLNWTKGGYFNLAGEIMPLMYNDKLSSYHSLHPDRRINNNTLAGADTVYSIATPVFYNWIYNGAYSNIYGSTWYGGSFKIENGVVILDNWTDAASFVLECVVSPKEGEEYYIPLIFREALISWLWWKDSKAVQVKRGMIGMANSLERDYYNNRRLARARYRPFHLEQAALV